MKLHSNCNEQWVVRLFTSKPLTGTQGAQGAQVVLMDQDGGCRINAQRGVFWKDGSLAKSQAA